MGKEGEWGKNGGKEKGKGLQTYYSRSPYKPLRLFE